MVMDLSPDNPAPRQPWLHELIIATAAPATALSDRSGSIGFAGTGVFVDDRRVVSHLTVTLDADEPSPVLACAVGRTAAFLGAARNVGDPSTDSTVEVHRTRTMHPRGITERIEVISRESTPIACRLNVAIAGDGAELSLVKSGTFDDGLAHALAATATPDGLVWSDERHRTTVSCTPSPTAVRPAAPGSTANPSDLTFELDLEPHGRRTIELDVQGERLGETGFDADSGHDAVSWDSIEVTATDARLERVVEVSLQDLRSLLLTDPLAPTDAFTAAGTPWYLTLFGRDSLWSARLMLPFGTELAAGTLRTLARRQGRRVDPSTAEEPGKIPHEVRRVAFEDPRAGLSLPPVYYGTVDATSLWLCLLVDAWRHGMPENEIRDLLPAARAAFGWLESAARTQDDGLVRYQDTSGRGLANQGWKDSDDAMRRADGTIAPTPIALLEAQGYAAEAAMKGAELLDALGEPGAPQWREFGEAMIGRIQDTFWVNEGTDSHLAMAVDGEGQLVDGVGSNMGHLLGAGVLTDDATARVVATLTSPDLLGEFGISTLSRTNPAFNPLGYHTGSVWTHDTAICALGMSRDGFSTQAGTVMRALVHAASSFDHRWPEVFAGDAVLGKPAPYPASCRPQGWAAASCAALVSVALGLQVDVPGRCVTVRPARPLPFGAMTVAGLRFGQDTFSVAVADDGSVSVTGLPDDVRIEA